MRNFITIAIMLIVSGCVEGQDVFHEVNREEAEFEQRANALCRDQTAPTKLERQLVLDEIDSCLAQIWPAQNTSTELREAEQKLQDQIESLWDNEPGASNIRYYAERFRRVYSLYDRCVVGVYQKYDLDRTLSDYVRRDTRFKLTGSVYIETTREAFRNVQVRLIISGVRFLREYPGPTDCPPLVTVELTNGSIRHMSRTHVAALLLTMPYPNYTYYEREDVEYNTWRESGYHRDQVEQDLIKRTQRAIEQQGQGSTCDSRVRVEQMLCESMGASDRRYAAGYELIDTSIFPHGFLERHVRCE